MKKKRAFYAAVVLLMVAVCAAWSGGQGGQSTTQARGETGMPYEGQTVDVLLMASPIVQKFENLVSGFEVMTGAKVNLLLITPANYDSKADMELLSPKGAYDVVWLPWRTFHRWIAADWFSPMDSFLENDELVDPQLLKKDGFAPAAYRALNVGGSQYALPIMAGAAILHYRTDVLENNGIAAPPDTWAELEQVVKKVHTSEVVGIGMRGSKKGGNVGLILPMVMSANGASMVKNYPTDMHPSVNQPAAIESARYYARLLQNYSFQGVLTASWQENVVVFQQGKMALYPDSNVLTGQILDPEKSVVVDKTGFAVVPKGTKARVSAAAVHGLGIPKNAPDKELGYKFIEWALSEDVQLDNALKHGYPAIIRPELMMRKDFQERFNWGGGQWATVCSETYAKYADPLYRPMTPEWRQVEEIFGIAMSNVLTGQAEVTEALNEANKGIYQVYKDAGYYTE